ncbi:S9 family peptidase [Lewinella sp. IMCC34183]|uniref:S9 family peptidase n=1 Tax=Lewinella sp. IMCC34183 TaxID=2248762 RepID=UPI000E27BCAC|nr:DPP IV N-terminal domain-containing protein [Lewinella sp. IMCC34183]
MLRYPTLLGLLLAALGPICLAAQTATPDSLLTLDRIYSGEFRQDYARPISWIDGGEAYVTIEQRDGADELVRYRSRDRDRSVYLGAEQLRLDSGPMAIEDFSLSPDGSQVLLFTNSRRVWRSNTKGDYWVYDRTTGTLRQLGTAFPASSLMFAKFSSDSRYAYYVHDFNLYREDYRTGETTALTHDGTGDLINGTFDWVYEEEFGKRDGFRLSPDDRYLAYWHLDASETGTFYMINNTDSIYSRPIPLRYPKVGQSPSAARIGLIDLTTDRTHWIPVPGGERDNYLPGLQWVNDDLLLIQQLNRHQNELTVWAYRPSDSDLRRVYTETEDTWVDLGYPDISANSWGNNDLPLVDDGSAFLRMTESDGWRHVYHVDITTGQQRLVTPGDYDVASLRTATRDSLYFVASPKNATRRYLYRTDLAGRGDTLRVTPQRYGGLNGYDVAPNGRYALHTHQSVTEAPTVRLVELPGHRTIDVLVDNAAYRAALAGLALPVTRFSEVTTSDGITTDVRTTYPVDFDSTRTYPVLFHVYGEPWGQVALDGPIGLWDIMMAQRGYVIVNMDNRGTPSLRGSEWRKSIYRKVGVINTRDQALAARELLKLPYLDSSRVAVWGWSGGGSMTLNLLFRYPDIYGTGVAVAAVSDQLIYDNIYQERYMGLPSENREDFVAGSPVTHAGGLAGNLLLIHGTADDNVHYQSAELLINELIRRNKQFDLMIYPNRSHGISEGTNTRRHLYTLITDYLLEHTPLNGAAQ